VLLTFRRRDGYKTRCPGCGKIVRLQPSEPPPAEPPPAHVPALEAFDVEEAFEAEPAEKMTVVVEEEIPFVQASEEMLTGTVVEAVAEAPWTWQWIAVAGGLVIWMGTLSGLAWLWWQ
jgi:hypothetical protein